MISKLIIFFYIATSTWEMRNAAMPRFVCFQTKAYYVNAVQL